MKPKLFICDHAKRKTCVAQGEDYKVCKHYEPHKKNIYCDSCLCYNKHGRKFTVNCVEVKNDQVDRKAT